MKPPEFICVGPPRTGTRFLYDGLQCFPTVWMPPVKEVGFWNQVERSKSGDLDANDIPYSEHGRATALGRLDPLISAFTNHGLDVRRELEFCRRYLFSEPRNLRWYTSLFGCAGNQITGDVTPDYYSLAPKTIAQMRHRLPTVRIIAMNRAPADQLWSLYNLDVRYGRLSPERRFDIDQVREWLRKETHWSLVRSAGLDNWREHFPDLLVVNFEQLTSDPAATLATVGTHLGCGEIDSGRLSGLTNVKSQQTPTATPAIQEILEEVAVLVARRRP